MTIKHEEQKPAAKKPFVTPHVRKEGKLPVITAGSGDLGTPEPQQPE